MTNKELAYELYNRYNGDEGMYHHNKCYIDLAYHLLQDEKECDIYPHIAFALASERYEDANEAFRKDYMEEAIIGFERITNRTEDVEKKLQIAREFVHRVNEKIKIDLENMPDHVLDKRVESYIKGVDILKKYINNIRDEGVYIRDIHVSLDKVDLVIDVEDGDTDEINQFRLHAEDAADFDFERENLDLFVGDFMVIPEKDRYNNDVVMICLDDIGYIKAKNITIEEIGCVDCP